MAYLIKIIESNLVDMDVYDICSYLSSTIKESKFSIYSIDAIFNKKASKYKIGILKLKGIRLKESKLYYGQHPYRNLPNPRKLKYLNTPDWVEFNDLINDTLDSLKVSANVTSCCCKIRQEYERSISYDFLDGKFLCEYENRIDKDVKG